MAAPSGVSWENIGGLDPAWTLPATCASITTHASWNYFVGCYAGKCDEKCLPTLALQGTRTNIWTYFSPAVCPTGYSTACKPQGAPDSLVVCCPTGFTCERGWDCAKNPFTNGVATFWNAAFDWPSVIPTSFALTTTGQSPEFAVINRGIIIASGGTVASKTSPPSSTSPSAPPSTNSQDAAAASSPQGGGTLSRDAIIAIGVTVPVSFALLIVGVFTYVRRRRRQRDDAKDPDGKGAAAGAFLPHFGRSELPTYPEEPPAEADSRAMLRAASKAKAGLVGQEAQEMQAREAAAQEMPAGNVPVPRYELHG